MVIPSRLQTRIVPYNKDSVFCFNGLGQIQDSVIVMNLPMTSVSVTGEALPEPSSPYILNLPTDDTQGAVWASLDLDAILPFPVKLLQTLTSVPNDWSDGGLANRQSWVAIQIMDGQACVLIDDGQQSASHVISSPQQLIFIPPLTWYRFLWISENVLMQIMSSESLCTHQANSITHYAEFLKDRHTALNAIHAA